MAAIRHVKDLPVEGKRVFLRVDFNVPLSKPEAGGRRRVTDDSRIRASLATIRHLLERGARLVIASHLGRPKGKPSPDTSLEPVAAHLAEVLGLDVTLADEPVGDGARKVVADLRDGQIAMLENLRFHPGEEANEDGFARALASYADVYVNDAFGTAHRAHASTVGMIPHLADAGAGFLMYEEVDKLSRLLGEVAPPYLAILGGAKVSDKIEVLEALLGRVDVIAIGGAMANTFLKARGHELGASLVEEDKLPVARNFLRKASEGKVQVRLPVDVVVAGSLEADSGSPVAVDQIKADQMALDIGPTSARAYADDIARARTIFWNGPMGVFERPPFAAGTLAVARAVADNRLAFTVVGGGDSVAAVNQAGVADKISHVSTGGGASLEFIQGLTLPGIEALEKAGR
ncbi:MAG TPA: phosphoglycerate kinase [Kofleriaceae bacterium]|nr:phosphoglycerate kinase [Kofleriaceae bacterium]